MRFPIKPHDGFWPGQIRHLLGAHFRKDPRLLLRAGHLSDEDFSKAVSNFHLGGTFKTTRPGRHALSNEMIRKHGLPEDAVILDLGASDGITSLELMQTLNFRFKKYYVTDRFPTINSLCTGKRCFFFDPEGRCTLMADALFVYYPQLSPLTRFLFGRSISRAENIARKSPELLQSTMLTHPRLLQEKNNRPQQIVLQSHDILKSWQGEQPFLIKAANVLNPGYFSKKQIRQALQHILHALPEKGLFLLVENRIPQRTQSGKKIRQEAAALYQKENQTFQLLQKAGAPIELCPNRSGLG